MANWSRSAAQPMLQIGRASVPLPPGAFLQATAEGEATLARLVLEHMPARPKRVADLFCGVGPFALRLAETRARHRRRQRCRRDRGAASARPRTHGLKPVEAQRARPVPPAVRGQPS